MYKCYGCETKVGEFEVACKACSAELIADLCTKCPWFLHDNNGVTIGMFGYSADYCTFHHSDLDEMTKNNCHGFDISRKPVNCACCNDERFDGVDELEECDTCGKIICLHCYDCDSGKCDTCSGNKK